jgi:hypothetical protein
LQTACDDIHFLNKSQFFYFRRFERRQSPAQAWRSNKSDCTHMVTPISAPMLPTKSTVSTYTCGLSKVKAAACTCASQS